MTTSDQRTVIVSSLLSAGYDREAVDQFLVYHQLNRWVWQRFKAEALEQLAAGAKHLGAKQICEEIRRKEPKDSKGFCLHWKVNNNYTAMYARVFAALHPQYRDRFSFRDVGGLRDVAQMSLELKERRYA